MEGTIRVVRLERGGYQRLAEAGANTRALSSGHVELAPGGSVGRHSTGRHEEMIIVLEGRGELAGPEGSHPIQAGHVAYVPPATEHDVSCTGDAPLRYIYVVAPVRPEPD